MPSFDIKSGINFHEVTNGVDQANRIIQNRFDFKGTGATISLEEGSFVLQSQQEFQLHQMLPILRESLAKRGVDLKALKPNEIEVSSGKDKQTILLIEGIDQETSKEIIQIIKSLKNKLQTSVQGEIIRVSGKKRDDLQNAMNSLKKADISIPLQFENLRD